MATDLPAMRAVSRLCGFAVYSVKPGWWFPNLVSILKEGWMEGSTCETLPMSVEPPPDAVLRSSSSTLGHSGWPRAAQFSRNASHMGPLDTMLAYLRHTVCRLSAVDGYDVQNQQPRLRHTVTSSNQTCHTRASR